MEEFAKKYFDLLTGEFKGINLTRINEFDDFYLKQIIDSVAPFCQSDVFNSSIVSRGTIIDIGFGGGFPLLPLAHLNPEKQFVGVETRAKKAKVVSQIAEKLGLSNVKFIHSRIENLIIDIPAVCTFKAVGKVGDFLGRINTDKNIKVFFYKGPGFYELEKDQFSSVKKYWNVIEEKELEVEGTDKRLIIGFSNKNVPHGTINAQNLVKMSELL